jgi:apolipoprotein N-acyltransferase
MERWAESSWKLPALSGVLLNLAYYTPLLIPNFLAFVPLLYWLDRHPLAGRYDRFKVGFVFGLVTHGISMHFLFSLLQFSWLAILLYVGVALAFGLRFGLFVMLLGWLRERTTLCWAVLLPACWLPIEWLQTFGDLRLTIDHIAHSLARFPFVVQFADLVGPYGVALLMLLVNGLLYESLLRRGEPVARRAAVTLAVLLALVLGYDLWAWQRPLPPGDSVRVAVIQPNIPLVIKMDDQTAQEQWDKLSRLSRKVAEEQPDFIVWPETARPRPLFHWLDRPETYAMNDVRFLARELDLPFLVGVEYLRVRSEEDYELYNAAMVVDADGVDPVWYAKAYLVAFAEALPFKRLFGPLLEDRGGEWRWVTGGFSPGRRDEVLQLGEWTVGALVCYEQMFADLTRGMRNAGAQLQVVVTNDAWFGRTLFQRYQADALRLRAIENRSAFVRAANTGISGFVDPRGVFHEATPLYEEALRVRDVRLSSRRTVYNRIGDAVIWPVLLALAWAIALAVRRTGRGSPRSLHESGGAR